MGLRTARQRLQAAEAFALEKVGIYPQSIIAEIQHQFGLPRTIARRVVQSLCDRKLLRTQLGPGATAYEVTRFASFDALFQISPAMQEHEIWYQCRPHLCWLPPNVLSICEYGVTEMVNNALEHADSSLLYLKLDYTVGKVSFSIIDTGVGVFKKVQQAMGLPHPEDALLELAKGKFTTKPDNHTGQGIFFTSKMFDSFTMLSDDLIFLATATGDNWLNKRKTASRIQGTAIMLDVDPQTDREPRTVFDEFSSDVSGFSKTKVPVRLADGGEPTLISRSQARALLLRFERFQEVILDFTNVKELGPSFADEVFRVFQANHPNTQIRWVGANEAVERMIVRALIGDAAEQR